MGVLRLFRGLWRYMPTRTRWSSSRWSRRGLRACTSLSRGSCCRMTRARCRSSCRTCWGTRIRRSRIRTSWRLRTCPSSSRPKGTKTTSTCKTCSNCPRSSSLVSIPCKYSASHNCSCNSRNARLNSLWLTPSPIRTLSKDWARIGSRKSNNRTKSSSSSWIYRGKLITSTPGNDRL